MNESQALQQMYPPGKRRTGKRAPGGVIQIHVTRACDKACFNCTQASNLSGPPYFISLDNFEKACVSLKDYFGTVGVFGGNPAIHPQFEELCEIIKKHIPFERRGLWCNNPLGKAKVMRGTFNPRASNLNCHMDDNAFREFKRDWPESLPFGNGKDSRHSPVFVSMREVIPDQAKRWELIANCDINKFWSAMIGQFRGELRGWFCEIAGAQSILMQEDPEYPDTGVNVVCPVCDNENREYCSACQQWWWELPMEAFSNQVHWHCHQCSVPLRGYGELACSADPDAKEQVSKTYASVYNPKRKARNVQIITTLEELDSKALKFTEYLQGADK